jgi:hypothetical protein
MIPLKKQERTFMAATVQYFGRFPTVIVMQSSSQFDGTTAQSAAPVISPGVYTFPAQAGGGLYAFHQDPVEIKQIACSGGGTVTVTKVVGTPGSTPVMSSAIGSITGAIPANFTNLFLAPGEYLQFTSSGSTTPKVSITGQLANASSDGAS